MGKKILVIDDVEYIGFMLKKNFEIFENVEIGYAESGMAGMNALEKQDYDLLILDLSLYDMEGLDVLKKLEEKGNKIPIIIISANYQKLDESKKFKAAGYFRKPINFDELNKLVKGLLQL